MNRRKFLGRLGLVAVAVAANPLRLFAKPLPPKLWGDGIHDDTAAIQSMIDAYPDGGTVFLSAGRYLIRGPLRLQPGSRLMFISGLTTLAKAG